MIMNAREGDVLGELLDTLDMCPHRRLQPTDQLPPSFK